MAGKKYIHTIRRNIGSDANSASIRFDVGTNKWQYSNDGSVYNDFGSGGGGDSIIVVDSYGDLPSPGSSGRLAIIRDTKTGVPYIDDGVWRPYSKGIIGAPFPPVSQFVQLGDASFEVEQGHLKCYIENSETVNCLVRNITTPTNTIVGTTVQHHMKPVRSDDECNYSVFSGVCFRESLSTKTYCVMVGHYPESMRLVKLLVFDSGGILYGADYSVPSIGSDLCYVKLQKNGTLIRSWFEIDKLFSGVYLEEFEQDTVFDSSPDQFGFCSYCYGTNNTAYFIDYLVQ